MEALKRGRPKQGVERILKVRIPIEEDNWLRAQASMENTNVSEVVRRELRAARIRKQAMQAA